MKSTTTTLKNGIKVANFNSPHPFIFEDESILKSVTPEFSKLTSLENYDKETYNGKFISVQKGFRMTDDCLVELLELSKSEVDVIIVPLPVLLLFKEHLHKTLQENKFFEVLTNKEVANIKSKIATCILTDRAKKICSISRFGQ